MTWLWKLHLTGNNISVLTKIKDKSKTHKFTLTLEHLEPRDKFAGKNTLSSRLDQQILIPKTKRIDIRLLEYF